jgi:hypothetical protein
MLELTVAGTTHRSNVRSGAAQDDRCGGEPAKLDGDVAGLVARCPFRLVRRVVLLVDDDDADVGEWRQHCNARTDHDACLAALDAPPLVAALALRERTVEQRDLRADVVLEPLEQWHGQSDLRDEDQRTTS